MFQNNEIISISRDVRIGVYYANVVKVADGQITLEQWEMEPGIVVAVQSDLDNGKRVVLERPDD